MIPAIKQAISHAYWYVKSFYVNHDLSEFKEGARQTVEIVASHPKTTVVITGLVNVHAFWMDYGEPIVKALTSVVGLVVIILLAIKHFLDIKHHVSKSKDDES